MSLRCFQSQIIAGISAVMLISLIPNAAAQTKPRPAYTCYTYKTDKTIDGNCLESACSLYCAAASPRIAMNDGLNGVIPGFFVGERHGRYVVRAVVPGSSAEASGMQPNDEVIAIDAAKLPLPSSSPIEWSTGKAHLVSVKRSQTRLSLSVRGDKVGDLVAGLVIANPLQNASTAGNNVLTLPASLYVSGLVMQSNGDARVAGVLAGSPAYEAGIRAGDMITRVNARPVTVFSAQLRRVVSGSDTRDSLTLDIARGNATRTLHLKTASLSSVLERAGAGSGDRDHPSAPMPLLGYNRPAR